MIHGPGTAGKVRIRIIAGVPCYPVNQHSCDVADQDSRHAQNRHDWTQAAAGMTTWEPEGGSVFKPAILFW